MTTAIAIQNLQKTYRNGMVALSGIDLTVQQGDFYALLGPNGAGKSTTIGILASLVRKTGGKVEIFAVDIDQDHAAAKRLIGLVPQEFNFNIFEKPFEIVMHQAGYYGIPRAKAKTQTEFLLHKLDLWEKRDQPALNLSGGMKRRLLIARALVHQPKLLILDEPTAGVDIELRRSMWQFLREINQGGTTIILTTHYLEEAESLCRNIGIINHGKMIANTSMRQLLAQLRMETFILDLADAIQVAPNCPGYTIRLLDPTTLEVDINKDTSINELFSLLSAQAIRVISLRNKSNRLEELFVHIVNQPKQVEIVA